MELIYQDTTRGLGILAFAVTTALPPSTVTPIGLAEGGGVFCFDPFSLYECGYLTNPNLLVLGEIGQGKSAFIKTMMVRASTSGRSFLILDPKGEYKPMAAALDASVIEFDTCGGVDPFAGVVWSDSNSVNSALTLLIQALLRRRLSALERVVIAGLTGAIVARGRVMHLVDCARLLDPSRDDWMSWMPRALVQRRALEMIAGLHAEFKRLIDGDLAGIFAHSDGGVACGERVVVDLSGVVQPELVALAVTVLLRTRIAQFRQRTLARGFVIVDEAWSVVAEAYNMAVVRSLFKLARAYGCCAVAVTHRISDLSGSEESLGMVSDVETVVAFSQPRSETEQLRTVLGFEAELGDLVVNLPRGVALWSIGRRRFLVYHTIFPNEMALVDTDAAMVTS
ncbi:MAG: helicase HerA domain-containing protein [Ferrimicrobium sp.]